MIDKNDYIEIFQDRHTIRLNKNRSNIAITWHCPGEKFKHTAHESGRGRANNWRQTKQGSAAADSHEALWYEVSLHLYICYFKNFIV